MSLLMMSLPMEDVLNLRASFDERSYCGIRSMGLEEGWEGSCAVNLETVSAIAAFTMVDSRQKLAGSRWSTSVDSVSVLF